MQDSFPLILLGYLFSKHRTNGAGKKTWKPLSGDPERHMGHAWRTHPSQKKLTIDDSENSVAW